MRRAAVAAGRRKRAPRCGWLTPRMWLDVERASHHYQRTGVALTVHGVLVGWQFRSMVGSQHEAKQPAPAATQPQCEQQEAQLAADGQQLTQRQQRRQKRSSERSRTFHMLQKFRQLVRRAAEAKRFTRFWAVAGPVRAARQAAASQAAAERQAAPAAAAQEPAPTEVRYVSGASRAGDEQRQSVEDSPMEDAAQPSAGANKRAADERSPGKAAAPSPAAAAGEGSKRRAARSLSLTSSAGASGSGSAWAQAVTGLLHQHLQEGGGRQ